MIVGIIFVLFLLLLFGLHYFYPYFFKAFRLTLLRGQWTASPYDLDDFPHRSIPNETPVPWSCDSGYNKGECSEAFKKRLQEMKTSAFLVTRHGKLIHEQYFGDHKGESLSNSFSMAKTIVALLTGRAIEDGYLSGLEQRVSEFFPEYLYSPADKLTIKDLIRMSSGMDWEENYYLPFNVTTEAYYGGNLSKLILERKIVDQPGSAFNYQSGNTQLLTMILHQVLPGSISDYLSECFWVPLGMENNAYWSVDSIDGIEKGYCCIHATARDFLKFGQLFLQEGRWNDKVLIPSDFLRFMQTIGFSNSPQYGGGLWLDDTHRPPFYLMRGHLGQYVIVLPSEGIAICRIGEKYMKDDHPPRLQLEDIYDYVDGAMELLN